jgi:G:T/U-mismatch repair DNA glycosylase
MPREQHAFTSGRWRGSIKDEHVLKNWFISKNDQNEVLSFGYMPDKDVESIFLGTFPIWQIVSGPIGGLNLEFFYGSVVNDFWNCLGNISNSTVTTVAERIKILNNYKIGLTDILETVLRSPNDCSSDSCLTGIRYNDILNLKANFPALKNIFITSGGRGPVANLNGNNKSVATWFKDAVSNYVTTGFNQAGFVKNITVNHIPFNLIYLYSPGNSANVALKGVLNANNNFNIPDLTIGELRRIQWCYFLNKYHTKFGCEIDVTMYGHLVEYFESN